MMIGSVRLHELPECRRLENSDSPGCPRSVPTGELAPINGYSWYRVLVKIPKEWDGQPLTLFSEALDDARSAYVGGQPVGATGTFLRSFAVVWEKRVAMLSMHRSSKPVNSTRSQSESIRMTLGQTSASLLLF